MIFKERSTRHRRSPRTRNADMTLTSTRGVHRAVVRAVRRDRSRRRPRRTARCGRATPLYGRSRRCPAPAAAASSRRSRLRRSGLGLAARASSADLDMCPPGRSARTSADEVAPAVTGLAWLRRAEGPVQRGRRSLARTGPAGAVWPMGEEHGQHEIVTRVPRRLVAAVSPLDVPRRSAEPLGPPAERAVGIPVRPEA